jgi:hypothetical protein
LRIKRAAVRAASAGMVTALGKKYSGMISIRITATGTARSILYLKTFCFRVIPL